MACMNNLTIGTWSQFNSRETTRLIAQSGFDWIVFDMEHGSVTFESLPSLIRETENSSCLPYVRVAYPEPIYIRRALDLGAKGIIIPMVNDFNTAKKCIDACFYPPMGNRGVGFCPANNYGENFHSYTKAINSEIKIVIQIEHVSAMKEIDLIFNLPGINAAMIGPYDLSASLGSIAEFDTNTYIKTKNEIFKKAQHYGIQPGIHIVTPDPNELDTHIKQDFTFIAFGIDAVFYQQALNNINKSIQRFKGVKNAIK